MNKAQRPVWLGEDRRTWDHVRVHLVMLKDERIGAYEIAVFLGLAAHAEVASGDAYPAISTLARYARCGATRVRAAIDTLVEAGYVEIEERPGESNVYRLLPPPPLRQAEGSPSYEGGHPFATSGPTPSPGGGEQEPVDENQEREGVLSSTSADDATLDADVDELCDHLADRIDQHGKVGRPVITERWRKDMRLLLTRGPLHVEDAHGLTVVQALAAIDFVFDRLNQPEGPRAFCWADQVRSPAALRDHLVQLRQAQRRLAAQGQPPPTAAQSAIANYAAARGVG